jgi:exonuclease SbcC
LKLLSIDLENIRSYQREKVDFRNGISLFAGDIGSGKSSILNAIEFALFGLGDLSGSHLIRVGENEAKVELDIEINGRPYTFGRTLKRSRNSVRQDACYIIYGDVKTDYNVSDMKKRVLQLLDFKEPSNPRSHSVIYRYAIFTPQEAMKEVLDQKPSERKETLRKAFGIEEYNTAAENSAQLVSEINVDMRILKQSEGEIAGIREKIGEETSQVTDLEKNIENNNKQISKLEGDKKEISRLLEAKRAELQNYREVKSNIEIQTNQKTIQEPLLEDTNRRLSEIDTEIGKTEEAKKFSEALLPRYEKLQENRAKRRQLEPEKTSYDRVIRQIELEKQSIENDRKNVNRKILDLEENKKRLEEQIESTQLELQSFPKLEDEAKQIGKATQELPKLRETLSDLTGLISSEGQLVKNLQTRKSDLTREWSEIKAIGVGAECPLCQQQLTPKHYELLEEKYAQEIKQVDEEIKKHSSKKEEIQREFLNTSNKIDELDVKQEKLQNLRLDIQSLRTSRKKLGDLKTELDGLTREISSLEGILEEKNFAQENRKTLQELQEQASRLEKTSIDYTLIKEAIEELEDEGVEKKYLENKSLADRKPDLEKEQKLANEEKEKLENALSDVKKELIRLNTELNKFVDPEKELKEIQDRDSETRSRISRLNALIEQNQIRILESRGRIQDHQNDLKRHQRNIEQSQEYGLIRSWLEEGFIPSIHAIEQNVLRKLHFEFNRLFKKWFKTLLESEDIEGYIDEEFTPIIDQSGYELEIDSLSGGEKTSVALAYRLALNTIVKQVTDTMKSNLLILDEPTDGFSREQLYKMRDILHDLNCEQVIMVSHENELESVADHIYKVHKEGTLSHVIEP